MTVKTEEIIEALKPVQDPELNRSIVELGMVKNVVIDGEQVTVEVLLTIAGCPLKAKIENDISDALLGINSISKVLVNFGVMNDEERAKVREIVHGDPASTAGSQPAHGHAEGRVIPFADPSCKTRVLLIASGKGGVGKTVVSTAMAMALAAEGKKVLLAESLKHSLRALKYS